MNAPCCLDTERAVDPHPRPSLRPDIGVRRRRPGNNLVNPAFSVLYHANGAPETIAYDAFGRMTATARGVLSASGANGATLDTVATPHDPTNGNPPVYSTQSWNLDQLGNWTPVTSNGSTD